MARITAQSAARLSDCASAFVVSSGGKGPPKLDAAAGDTSIYTQLEDDLSEILEQVGAEQQALIWHPSAASATHCTAAPIDDVGALLTIGSDSGATGAPGELGTLSTLAALSSVAIRNARLSDAQRNFFVHVTGILAAALDTHMRVQTGHSRRVAHMANQLGRALGFDDDRRQRLHFASLLHDVGMLRIDHRLGVKAYRQHATLGSGCWHRSSSGRRSHPWCSITTSGDGNGYPEGLSGEEIPLESRIIGLAEAFDSMTSRSSYKEPVDVDEALRRVDQGSGSQFDPEIARLFLELARRGEIQAE